MVSNGGDDNLSGTWHAWSMLRHSWACVRTWITFLELAHMVDATPLMGLGWGAVGGVTTPLERAHMVDATQIMGLGWGAVEGIALAHMSLSL